MTLDRNRCACLIYAAFLNASPLLQHAYAPGPLLTPNARSCLAIVSLAFPRIGLSLPDRFAADSTGALFALLENQPVVLKEKQRTRRVERTVMKDRGGIVQASEAHTRVCMY